MKTLGTIVARMLNTRRTVSAGEAEERLETPATSYADSVISARGLIDALTPPVTDAAIEHARRAIDAEAAEIGDAIEKKHYDDLQHTQAVADTGRAGCDLRRQRLADTEQASRTHGAGSAIRTVLFDLGAVACFLGEFELTWAVLPFLLSVPQHSFLGVMLGLAPATALLVLEIPLARLLEKPWRAARDRTQSGWLRGCACAAMAVFLLALAFVNLYTVKLLADARKEGVTIRRILEQTDIDPADSDQEPTVDRDVINRAIVWISIVVTLDGAVLLLLALADGRGVALRVRAARQRMALERRERRMRDAAARAEVCRHDWERAGERAAHVATVHRESLLSALAQRSQPRRRTHLDRVDELLSGVGALGQRPAARPAVVH